jgi:hypothetical protein
MTGLGSARSVRQRRFFGARDAPVSRVWQWQSPNRPRSRRQRACVAMLPPRAGPTRTEVDHHLVPAGLGRAVTGLLRPHSDQRPPLLPAQGELRIRIRGGATRRARPKALGWRRGGAPFARTPSVGRCAFRARPRQQPVDGLGPFLRNAAWCGLRGPQLPETAPAATTATLLHLTSVSRAPYAATFATLPPGP